MKMKSVLFICSIALLLSAFSGCMINSGVKGSGKIVEKEISIDDYQKMIINGSGNLVYECKNDMPAYLRVEVDENILPLLEITTDGDKTLRIEGKNIRPTKCNIFTNSTALMEVINNGSANIKLMGTIESEYFKVHISGSGSVEGDTVKSSSVEASIAGSGNITLNGTTQDASYDIRGSGNINVMGLQSDNTHAKITGSGNISLFAQKFLDVNITGSGSIKYKGNPQINKSVTGSGKLQNISN